MSLNDLKAEFGQAYVRAIAHAAGYFIQEASRNMDADGIDLTMFKRSAEGPASSPRLDIQLKTTAKPNSEDPFAFDLPIKNYNDLRAFPLQLPRILVVVVVPKDAADWVSATEEALLLRHCGYWVSLRGAAASENSATVRVQIPRASCFHVSQVRAIMDRIQEVGFV